MYDVSFSVNELFYVHYLHLISIQRKMLSSGILRPIHFDHQALTFCVSLCYYSSKINTKRRPTSRLTAVTASNKLDYIFPDESVSCVSVFSIGWHCQWKPSIGKIQLQRHLPKCQACSKLSPLCLPN